MPDRPSAGASARAGFALIFVLGIGVLLSTGAVILLQTSHWSAKDLDVARNELDRRAAENAGVALAVAAIGRRAPSTAVAVLPPVFVGDRTVDVTISNEAAKVDVNASDLALVGAALETLPAATATIALDRLSAFRARGEVVPDVGMLLPPCLRSTTMAGRLENLLTTSTSVPTVSRRLVPRQLLARLPGISALQLGLLEADREGRTMFGDDPRIAPVARYLGETKPIWRVDVSVVGQGGGTASRRALVSSEGRKTPSVVWSRAAPPQLPIAYCS